MARRSRSQILGKRYQREQDKLVDQARALQQEIRHIQRQLRRYRGNAEVMVGPGGGLQVVVPEGTEEAAAGN